MLAFGQTWRIVDPGYAVKIFPAKFSTHYAITAALALRPKIPSADAIRAIHIIAADVPSSDRPHPHSGLDGKFSLQYTTAVALLDGLVGLSSFTHEILARADVQDLLGKTHVTLSREIPSLYTAGRYLDLEITLANGEILKSRCERPRGSWGAPPITDEEHRQKARDCLLTYMSVDRAEDCIAQCGNIDALDGQGVRRLLALASTGKAPC